jgi:GT2 family glycosyltransferase
MRAEGDVAEREGLSPRISVVIPTYRREQVLLDTIRQLTAQRPAAAEILVIDQTHQHAAQTQRELERLNDQSVIRWIQLSRPSIPAAMNRGLIEAHAEIVLFLDDDIVPCPGLIMAHMRAHQESKAAVVAGRVIQPWDDEATSNTTSNNARSWTSEFMAGNVSMTRRLAVWLGGFDENFVQVAYRFEREFADRVLVSGERILFEPEARIHHLKAPNGGTRSYGHHLRTVRPSHAVGEYYYLLGRRSGGRLLPVLSRPVRAVGTRHHLRSPWWIPVTLTAEVLGFAWAVRLRMRGPRYLEGGASAERKRPWTSLS